MPRSCPYRMARSARLSEGSTDSNARPVIAEGQQVGLQAAPEDVRLVGADRAVGGRGQVVREFPD
jgi:hypothetical protein